ncbi:MAG: hypothetical protein WCP97_03730 [bacterium]
MQEQFQQFLIQEMGVDPATSLTMCREMEACAQDWLLLSIIELLPQQDVVDFDHLVSISAPSAVISQFLASRIPNLEQLLAERLRLFQQDIIDAILDLKKNSQPISSAVVIDKIEKDSAAKEQSPKVKEKQPTIGELNRNIQKAVKKSDWATAASLVQQRKKLIK